MLSALKMKRFQPDFAIFFAHFLPTVKMPQISKRPLNLGRKAEYFKRVKIRRITFGILWMKSQFQPDFADNFSFGINILHPIQITKFYFNSTNTLLLFATTLMLSIRQVMHFNDEFNSDVNHLLFQVVHKILFWCNF